MKTLSRCLILVLVSWFFAGCTITHGYGPYTGKVIDAETREPVEGAVVLMVFYTQTFGITIAQSKFIDAVEVLTDKKGEFTIPKKRVFSGRPLSWWDDHGHVTIFKPGYGCYPAHQGVKPMFAPAGTLPARQYVTIELPKLKTREERLANTDPYPLAVPDSKMPEFIKLCNVENVNLGLKPTHRKEDSK